MTRSANAVSIHASELGVCVVAGTPSQVYCWGAIYGVRAPAVPGTPVMVPGFEGATLVRVAQYSGVCALVAGEVRCAGTIPPRPSFPYETQVVPGFHDATLLAVGNDAVCAGSHAGIRCVGNNYSALLGTDLDAWPPAWISTPVEIAGTVGARALASAELGACAFIELPPPDYNATVCWGDVIRPDVSVRSRVPFRLFTHAGAVPLVARDHAFCTVFPGGLAQCWGATYEPASRGLFSESYDPGARMIPVGLRRSY